MEKTFKEFQTVDAQIKPSAFKDVRPFSSVKLSKEWEDWAMEIIDYLVGTGDEWKLIDLELFREYSNTSLGDVGFIDEISMFFIGPVVAGLFAPNWMKVYNSEYKRISGFPIMEEERLYNISRKTKLR